jgi:hypothetical protein
LYFRKGKFGGKNFTWQKSDTALQRRFFQSLLMVPVQIMTGPNGGEI